MPHPESSQTGYAKALALIEQAGAEGWRVLDLAGLGLEVLPPEIGGLVGLEELVLGKFDNEKREIAGNTLTTLPPEIGQLQNLQNLKASHNKFRDFPEAIAQLKNLTELHLSNNQITVISGSISQLKNLTKLFLTGNQIAAVHDTLENLCLALAQLSNLTELYLSNNEITVVTGSITQLSSLAKFSLSYNQIAIEPNALENLCVTLAQLTNLTSLDLRSNKIAVIPDAIAQLSNLTSLSLSSNQIAVIPDAIAQLTNLTSLSLSSNQIVVIPDAIAQLTNLTSLSLSSNQIAVIPDAIAQLTNLTSLSLSSNQIAVIPDAIAQLTNLTSLYLGSNQIAVIPESIAQLSNLTSLDLGSNQINLISDALCQLTNLTEICLNHNQINLISDAIAQLTNLTSLSLWSNQINLIPDAITQLTNLASLNLGDNQINLIPDAIAQLSNLTELNLFGNQIAVIPDFLATLPNLKKLDLRRNPLPISPEILGPPQGKPGSVANIFNYLNQLRSGEVRPLNEAKLLLVGQGSVGKTSLINRLLHDRHNPTEPQTDGLAVHTWPIHVNSKDIRLNVWDFGGQEIYHATHQFFLTKRSLYLLVCNCRTSEDENRLEYWLKLIQSFGDASPVIIVGNKKDEQPLDLNRKALREKYPNIKAILETSCQTGDGIPELRTAIRQQIAQLREVYDLLPLKWFEVKEQLEAMDQDFMSYNQYISLCCQNNIPEEQNQNQLIGLLHNLGLVLNYRDHPILQSTNVLNPDWVTTGIYNLFSDDTLKTETKGILAPTDLNRILDPQRYPPSRHKYLIELMKEFQLGFDLPNCPQSRFLIPGLLPKEEPDNTRLKGETLEFQYHYDVLPLSVISRFIVLTHERIHDQTLWRSGVMLAYREGTETYNIARIKADPEDCKIFISISGRDNTRRIFLSILRDTFRTIHRPTDDITEWVPVPGHPIADPLEYQDLLGLEEMGETTVLIGKLKLRLDLRQLLDGYESRESRQQRRMRDRDPDDRRFRQDPEVELLREVQLLNPPQHINLNVNVNNNQTQEVTPTMSTFNQTNHGGNNSQNDISGGTNYIGTNTINNNPDPKTPAEAAKEIQDLLLQLAKDNPLASDDDRAIYLTTKLAPNRLQRIFEIVQAAGEAAVEEIPGGKIAVAVLKKVREQETLLNQAKPQQQLPPKS